LEQNYKDFKILWWSNAEWAPTGYGTGTKGAIEQIKDRYDVRLLCFWGLEGRAMMIDDVLHYPKMFTFLGEDAAETIIKSSDWNPDLMITFFDIFIGEQPSLVAERNWFTKITEGTSTHWIPWAPQDHDPCPWAIANQAKQAFKVVSMSKFGKRTFADQGIDSTYIPLGTNTKIFKPAPYKHEEDVQWLIEHTIPLNDRKNLAWDADSFIIGINAAPKDPVRKGFREMFKAFKIFLDQNPDAKKDARMHLHTYNHFPGGMPMDSYTNHVGIMEYIRWTHPYNLYVGYAEEHLAQMYNAWKINFGLSRREGFGLVFLETAAMGIPSIGTDFTSIPELVDGHGWLVPSEGGEDFNVGKEPTPLEGYGAKPDIYAAVDALEDAYNNPEKLEDLGKKARAFSLDYDWDVVGKMWIDFLDGVREELRPRDLAERRML